jgi:hypothetical protein
MSNKNIKTLISMAIIIIFLISNFSISLAVENQSSQGTNGNQHTPDQGAGAPEGDNQSQTGQGTNQSRTGGESERPTQPTTPTTPTQPAPSPTPTANDTEFSNLTDVQLNLLLLSLIIKSIADSLQGERDIEEKKEYAKLEELRKKGTISEQDYLAARYSIGKYYEDERSEIIGYLYFIIVALVGPYVPKSPETPA